MPASKELPKSFLREHYVTLRTDWIPVPLTSKIVKFFTKTRDGREQTISAERQLVLAGGPAALWHFSY
jgi:hypothetical protein